MSQVAILKQNVGNGKQSRAVISKHHSEAHSWKITVTPAKKTTTYFDYFKACSEDTCEYPSDKNMVIGYNLIKITDTTESPGKDGLVYARFDELNADGSLKTDGESCAPSGITLTVGECAGLSDVFGTCALVKVDCSKFRYVALSPRSPGTYYFGMKTWGADESEPAYPTPAALFEAEAVEAAPASEKWCIPATPISPEICLEPGQWVVTGVLGTVACAGTYFAVRRAKGKL